jgi:hypothetical protein
MKCNKCKNTKHSSYFIENNKNYKTCNQCRKTKKQTSNETSKKNEEIHKCSTCKKIKSFDTYKTCKNCRDEKKLRYRKIKAEEEEEEMIERIMEHKRTDIKMMDPLWAEKEEYEALSKKLEMLKFKINANLPSNNEYIIYKNEISKAIRRRRELRRIIYPKEIGEEKNNELLEIDLNNILQLRIEYIETHEKILEFEYTIRDWCDWWEKKDDEWERLFRLKDELGIHELRNKRKMLEIDLLDLMWKYKTNRNYVPDDQVNFYNKFGYFSINFCDIDSNIIYGIDKISLKSDNTLIKWKDKFNRMQFDVKFNSGVTKEIAEQISRKFGNINIVEEDGRLFYRKKILYNPEDEEIIQYNDYDICINKTFKINVRQN